jgi:hypothetical protein
MKKQTRFVISAGPKPRARPRTRYIANNGSTTTIRSKAARFWSYWDAKEFAEVNHITLNAGAYIDREDFTELDLRGEQTVADLMG